MKKNKYAYRDLQGYCNFNSFNYIPSLLITSKYNGDSSTYKISIRNSINNFWERSFNNEL